MKKVFLIIGLLAFSQLSFGELKQFNFPSSLGSLRNECLRLEDQFPDFACLKFEFYQSSPETLQADLTELIDTNDYNLRTSTWPELMRMLMASMDAQIYRYQNPDDIEVLRRIKAKNQWELLKLKDGLRDFWVDPHTYWYPSVDAISFIAINEKTSQILVISHGERN
ncbi:hypothetical protein [Bdellovibrio sp. HCB-162]|uniref:hypothetical protein n=1 Tax=Bdellovibrio sp. HCB-162 TaxID=3394234 RepID=UPI0039BD4242